MHKILIIDSGIGGLSLARRIESVSDITGIKTQIIYHADSDNFPYGNKSYEELKIIISHTLSQLLEIHKIFELIIIACNTASIIINDLCEKAYDLFSIESSNKIKFPNLIKKYKNIPIIDVISNLKQILSEESDITVLTTQFTAQYLPKLITNPNNCQILALPKLASLIEFNQFDQIAAYLKSNIKHQPKKIAYGCTHFSLAHKIFEKLFQAQYFDPENITFEQILESLAQKRNFQLLSNLKSLSPPFDIKLIKY